MFSKACEYGIRAAIHISGESQMGKRSSLNEIANAIDSPVAFTGKILQLLAKSEIIRSIKGPTGGYEIDTEKLGEITLYKIVEAIDGDRIYNGCGLGLQECNALKPCPVHHEFAVIRDSLKSMLEGTSMIGLSNSLMNGSTFLKR